MSAGLMSGPSHALVYMALEQLMLAKKSGIIDHSIFGLVSEGLGTEDV